MEPISVLVLFGGCSPEYGVSLQSAAAVLRHMDGGRCRPLPVGITRGGEWLHYAGDIRRIPDNTWQSADCAPALLSPSRSGHELLVLRGEQTERHPIDAVFPVLHGQNGEDGTVQGLCELAGIPLAGCGTLASALCMDKDRAHKLARAAGIAVPRSFLLESGCVENKALRRAEALGFPLFVKPVRAGSSYGVTRVARPGELPAAVRSAFSYDSQVLLEEEIPGFEVGCAVMGNGRLLTGEVDEIELAGGFFDHTEKYTLQTAKIHLPARISPERAAAVKRAARTVYRALACRGFARIDFFLTPSGRIVFNEANTIPGFTEHSRFPGMMAAAGVSLEQVVSRAVELAMESRPASREKAASPGRTGQGRERTRV